DRMDRRLDLRRSVWLSQVALSLSGRDPRCVLPPSGGRGLGPHPGRALDGFCAAAGHRNTKPGIRLGAPLGSLGSVPPHHFFLRSRPTPPPGFGIETATEFLTILDGTHIAGRSFAP